MDERLHIAEGSKLGIHANKVTDALYEHVEAATAQGIPFPAVKLTQEFTSLQAVKERSPDTLTIARAVAPMDGMGGVGDISDSEVDGVADAVLVPLYKFAANNPDFQDWIDIWEFINEADPEGDRGYLMLGKVMRRCVEKASKDFPDMAWGVGSFNMGTPEYSEMRAFVDSGVFDLPNVVLCLHEGVRTPDDPINLWHSSEDDDSETQNPDTGLIPGAPSVPEHGGALYGRVAYWHQLLGDARMPPVIISEAYLHHYGNKDEIRRRAAWVDDLYSKLWYVVAWLPFTHSPTDRWRNQDYTTAYPDLIAHMATVKNRENAKLPAAPRLPVNEQMRAGAWKSKKISINSNAALSSRAKADGMWPMGDEFDEVVADGRRLRGQLYGNPSGPDVWIYMAEVGKWNHVWRINALEEDAPYPTLLSPVGTEEERLAFAAGNPGPKGWPGEWQDANPHGNLYQLRGRMQYHTGADLNLNKPVWNSDRGQPVFAPADGEVTYAGRFNSNWGNLVVVRHDGFYSRSAHMATVLVKAGEHVTIGQQIGTVGGSEVGLPDHLHFDISLTDRLALNPGDWPGSDLARLRRDYVDPRTFLLGEGSSTEPSATPGIDVSHNNGRMNWAKAHDAGARLALIRSTQGVTIVDREFERNRNIAPRTGFSVIPWHFFQEPHRAGDQVAWFLQHTPPGYRVYGVDAEISRRADGTLRYPIPHPNNVYNFVQGLRQQRPGCRVLLYTNLQWLETVPLDHPIRGSCDLWVAAWGASEPAIPAGWNRWTVWQYTVSNDADKWGASSSQIDLDLFNGTLTQLHAYAGKPEDMPVASDEPQPPPPAGQLIDLRRFKIADPDCWRVVKHVDGNGHETNEDVQDMDLGHGRFVRRKNANAEWHAHDSEFFYLIHDTSPAPGSEGIERVYTLYKNGVPGAPKSKLQQRVGETWVESGHHQVQFRARSGCRQLAENSGNAQNRSVITRYERNYTFNRFGQNLTFDEVVWEQTGVETQIYGRRNGKSCGWIGWSAPWGNSEPIEIHWNRGRLTREPDRICPW